MKTEQKHLVSGILIGAGAVGVFALGALAGTVNKAPTSNLTAATVSSPAPQAAPAVPAPNNQARGSVGCGV